MPASNDASLAAELAPILAHLNTGPSRTWSVIITVFGDAIVPRGGSVGLGTLLTIFRSLDIGDGVVRTAMSRLTADGWLERTKVGRNSYYRLRSAGREAFARASEQIYTRRPPTWSGHFDMVMIAEDTKREVVKSALDAAGFGMPAPGVWIAPAGTDMPGINGLIRLTLAGEPAEMRALAARAWALEATAAAYTRFITAFAPLRMALDDGLVLSDRDAFLARTLLIHEYRRIVLRDPVLPPEVLSPDWSGTAARQICGAIYRHVIGASERWLDENAIGEDGAVLPPNSAVMSVRFRD